MKSFVFDGNWSFSLQLKHLKEFRQRQNVHYQNTQDGWLHIKIEDELNDCPDPTPAQLKAINYLLQHPQATLDAICTKVFNAYPSLKKQHGYRPQYDDDIFPLVGKPQDIRKLIGIETVHVLIAEKDAQAYLSVTGNCSWNETQGIGCLLHKDRVVALGAADDINVWQAYQDNGTSEQKQAEWQTMPPQETQKPIKYTPHPKYGKLKPSQELANKGYEYRLIERGHIEEFKQLIESGECSVDTKTGYLNMSFLERACQCNNDDLVAYILSKSPSETRNCIHYAVRHTNKRMVSMLIAHGADINQPNHFGETPLYFLMSLINSYYSRQNATQEIVQLKDMAKWLIMQGADPCVGQDNPHNVLDLFAEQPHQVKQEIEGFIATTQTEL